MKTTLKYKRTTAFRAKKVGAMKVRAQVSTYCSSNPSWQSTTPSQTELLSRQRLSEQINFPTAQLPSCLNKQLVS